jgi:hypothetical protein
MESTCSAYVLSVVWISEVAVRGEEQVYSCYNYCMVKLVLHIGAIERK